MFVMRVNTVGKKFFEVELAYLAGFLDADGCIMATIEKHQEKKFGFRVRLTLKISQADRKILNYFISYYKIGYIRKNRTTFDWVIRDQKKVKDFLQILLPYLKVKRKQAQKALQISNTRIRELNDLIKVASLADSLSRLNVRSKNRRKNFVSMIKENFSRND